MFFRTSATSLYNCDFYDICVPRDPFHSLRCPPAIIFGHVDGQPVHWNVINLHFVFMGRLSCMLKTVDLTTSTTSGKLLNVRVNIHCCCGWCGLAHLEIRISLSHQCCRRRLLFLHKVSI